MYGETLLLQGRFYPLAVSACARSVRLSRESYRDSILRQRLVLLKINFDALMIHFSSYMYLQLYIGGQQRCTEHVHSSYTFVGASSNMWGYGFSSHRLWVIG